MYHDYPSQVGWNEWKSVWDGNSGGVGMQNQQQLYRPFADLQWRDPSYYQQIPSPSAYQLEMNKLQQMMQMQGYMGNEERDLLTRVHSRAKHYQLRLLQELALA